MLSTFFLFTFYFNSCIFLLKNQNYIYTCKINNNNPMNLYIVKNSYKIEKLNQKIIIYVKIIWIMKDFKRVKNIGIFKHIYGVVQNEFGQI